MNRILESTRRDYQFSTLDEGTVAGTPSEQFSAWLQDAYRAGIDEPNAMTLATASKEGVPSARMVLLRGFDERGFCFYTHYNSPKGLDLEENPRAALVFYWPVLERQVRVTGSVVRLSRAESEQYFQTRPRGSRLSAWASRQSQVLSDREELEAEWQRLERTYPNEEIPIPPHWGGYRLVPDSIEFWQGRPNRLHDRLRFRRASGWILERLAP